MSQGAVPPAAAPGPPALTFELVSIFPEIFDSFLGTSLIGKAIVAGLLGAHRSNPRDFADGKHQSVDDTPYGGGPGMIFRPQPLADCMDHIGATRGPSHRIVLSPQGTLLTQCKAAELAEKKRISLICGRYEGIDERFVQAYADEVLSVGDYVLAGGEMAACIVIEAVARLVPGVLGCASSVEDESHAAGRLEYPQWTRPPEFRGQKVPAVLTSGDHAAIARWRHEQSLLRTAQRRPDLLRTHPPEAGDTVLLDRWRQEGVLRSDKTPGYDDNPRDDGS